MRWLRSGPRPPLQGIRITNTHTQRRVPGTVYSRPSRQRGRPHSTSRAHGSQTPKARQRRPQHLNIYHTAPAGGVRRSVEEGEWTESTQRKSAPRSQELLKRAEFFWYKGHFDHTHTTPPGLRGTFESHQCNPNTAGNV